MDQLISAQVLRAKREARGWDQRTLAQAAGVAPSVVSRLERGLQRDLKVSVLVGLASALETSADSLLAAMILPPPDLSTALAATVPQLGRLTEKQQLQVAALLRAYLATAFD